METRKTDIACAWFAAVMAACAPFAACMADEIDGIAARVGTETILKSDVRIEMARMRAPASDYEKVRNAMIDRKLVLKAAGEAKMTMQDWVVDNNIRDIVERTFGGDRNKLVEALAAQKTPYPEWRARMKEDMIVSAMRWSVVGKNATASPAAMKKEFEAHPERYMTDSRVSVSVVMLKPEDASKRDAVAAAIRTNDFAAVAREFSADGRAADGGRWTDIVPAEVFRPEICDEIAKMPKGTISHWIELDGWSFLIRKDAETPGRKLTFPEAYDRVEENVKAEAEKASYEAWLERLRSETYIKVY